MELDLAPEGRADVNALGFAARLRRSRLPRGGHRAAARPARGRRSASPSRPCSASTDPHGVWTELEHRLGRAVFEIPTLPPSVPGMRVHKSLPEALRRAGGRVILNTVVTGADEQSGRVSALRARVGLREERRGADWVVLATGGIASGGVELDSRWRARETALGLPVTGVPGAGRGALPARLLRRAPDGPRRGGGGPRAAARGRRGARGCTRTSSWPGRRSPVPSPGARSPATA